MHTHVMKRMKLSETRLRIELYWVAADFAQDTARIPVINNEYSGAEITSVANKQDTGVMKRHKR